MWKFDAKFVDDLGHEMANVQKATGDGHFLLMKNSAYHCPYDLADNKVSGGSRLVIWGFIPSQ